MATLTKVQEHRNNGTGNVVVTFPSTPTEGNKLVVQAMDRSGATSGSISGTGWEARVARIIGGDNRRSLFVWEKTAGASEATAVTVNLDGVASHVYAVEYEHSGGGTYEFVEVVEANDGETDTNGAFSLGSGNTSSLPSGDYALIACWAAKPAGANSYTGTSFTGLSVALTMVLDGSYGRSLAAGYGLLESTSGVKSTTASDNYDGTTEGSTLALLVFEVTTGGEPTRTALVTRAKPLGVAHGMNFGVQY